MIRPGARTRPRRMLAAGAAALALVAGCAPIPTAGPDLATGDRPGGRDDRGAAADTSTPPEWLAPRGDLAWAPCPDGEVPTGSDADLDCARLAETGVVRVTTERTPADAPPLVVVPGPDLPAAEAAARIAGAGTELTDAHPVVVLDHRGRRGLADGCLTAPTRRALDHLADRDADPGSPATRGALADTAQACTDQLVGAELDHGSKAAAEDLESLRAAWDVPGLAVLGMGAGARTALHHATEHPDAVALLVLDSPAPADGDQEAAARAALDGSDAALRLWAASCTRPACGTGGAEEKVDVVERALDAARDPDAPVPAALLADVVRDALGDLAGGSSPEPAPGDRLLGDLVSARPGEVPASVRDRAGALAAHSLPYVAGCSDLSDRVPVSRVVELADEWAGRGPLGEILALQLSACSTWPVPSPEPVALTGRAPVLLVGGTADPVAGAAAVEPTAGALTAAGAREPVTVTWGAPGSRAVLHSPCVRSAVAGFLADPTAVDPSACPS